MEKKSKTNKKRLIKNEFKNLKNLGPYPNSEKFSDQTKFSSAHCNDFSSTQSEIGKLPELDMEENWKMLRGKKRKIERS